MGLQEKRIVKAFQDNQYQKLTAEINAIAGYDLEYEVKWDTLIDEDHSHLFEECIPKVFFDPLILSLKEITSDDMGKDALKETLKKVVMKNETSNYSANRTYSFENGTLIIDHTPFSNVDEIESRSEALNSVLNKVL